MYPLKVVIFILWSYALGKAFLWHFAGFKKSNTFNNALSVIFGTGILSLSALLLNDVGLPFDLRTLSLFTAGSLVASALLAAVFFINKGAFTTYKPNLRILPHRPIVRNLPRRLYLLVPLVVLMIAGYYFEYTHLSWAYDSITQWQGRGISWACDRHISTNFGYGLSRHPPLYAVILGVEHLIGMPNPGIISAVLVCSLLLLFSRIFSSQELRFSLVLLLLCFVTLPQLALRLFIGTSEVFTAAFAVSGLIVVLRNLKRADWRIWMIAGILWGIFAGSRSDDLVYVCCMCAPLYCYLIYKKRWTSLFIHTVALGGVAVFVYMSYPIATGSIEIRLLWIKPLLVFSRIVKVFLAAITAQISENAVSVTAVFVISLTFNRFRLGWGKLPFFVALANLAGLSIVFGIIDSFWTDTYLNTWMHELAYLHEGDGGISRYTLVANVLLFASAGLMMRQALLTRRTITPDPVILRAAVISLCAVVLFGFFKYYQETSYRYTCGSMISAITGILPIDIFSATESKLPEIRPGGTHKISVAKGEYDVKLFTLQSSGENDRYVDWLIKDNAGKVSRLSYQLGGIYTSPSEVINPVGRIDLSEGPISLTAQNLNARTEVQLDRIEITNAGMNAAARFVPWSVIIGVSLALSIPIFQYYTAKRGAKLNRAIPASHAPSSPTRRRHPAPRTARRQQAARPLYSIATVLAGHPLRDPHPRLLILAAIAFSILPFASQSAFVYLRELSLAAYCKYHTYNDAMGMQFGLYFKNVLRLIDQHAVTGQPISFHSAEFTPSMIGPLILYQKYGSSIPLLASPSVTDTDLLEPASTAAKRLGFVVIAESPKHPDLDTIFSKYQHWVAPVSGELAIKAHNISFQHDGITNVIKGNGAAQMAVTAKEIKINAEVYDDLQPLVQIIIPAQDPNNPPNQKRLLSFEPSFDWEYWTAPRFQYRVTMDDGSVVVDHAYIDLRNQPLAIPDIAAASPNPRNLTVTIFLERRKYLGKLLAEYLIDVRSARTK
jgi:hypothetical protein